MNIPDNAFELNKAALTREDGNQLERENRPICQIYKTSGKYKYFQVDFITSNWRLSAEGENKLQSMMNMELIFMWLRGYNLKPNYTSIGRTTIFLRCDDLAINYLLTKLNELKQYNQFWEQYRDNNRMLVTEKNNQHVMPIHHVKNNTKKVS